MKEKVLGKGKGHNGRGTDRHSSRQGCRRGARWEGTLSRGLSEVSSLGPDILQAARATSAKPRRASMRGVRDIEEAGVAGHRE